MNTSKLYLIQTVQMISDLEAQKSYEKNVPIADIPSELISSWFDDCWYPDDKEFLNLFTTKEINVLKEFSAYYEQKLKKMPLTSFSEMHESFQWQQVVGKAQWVLSLLHWQGEFNEKSS